MAGWSSGGVAAADPSSSSPTNGNTRSIAEGWCGRVCQWLQPPCMAAAARAGCALRVQLGVHARAQPGAQP